MQVIREVFKAHISVDTDLWILKCNPQNTRVSQKQSLSILSSKFGDKQMPNLSKETARANSNRPLLCNS